MDCAHAATVSSNTRKRERNTSNLRKRGTRSSIIVRRIPLFQRLEFCRQQKRNGVSFANGSDQRENALRIPLRKRRAEEYAEPQRKTRDPDVWPVRK